jgi:hypothetical protein
VTAAALAAIYLLLDPHTGDHASAVYRTWLFEHEGFSVWDNNWYSGHHIPAYSVLYPPLAALVGVRVAGALAAVAAAALFEKLTDNKVAAQWFALGTATLLVTGRLPFLLGVAFAVGALVGLRRQNLWIVVPAAIACGLASPVAGFFLALVAVAVVVDPARRSLAIITAVAGLLPALLLSIAFPEGGSFPFEPSSFWPQLAGTLFVLFLITFKRDADLKRDPLVIGTVLYALVLIVAFAVESPMGGNAVRLGALASGPVVAVVLWPDRKWWLAAAAVPLLFWQWNAPVDNLLRTRGDDSVHAKYYDELNAQLAKRNAQRVEIPFTENHWEAAYVAPQTPLARGWERQLDRKYNRLFYVGGLTPQKYARWLKDHAISHVAVADAPLDYSAKAQAKVIATGVPGLKKVWRGKHWTLYEVTKARALAKGASVITSGHDKIELVADQPGPVDLRLRWTPYWRIVKGSGCLTKHGEWTRITGAEIGAMTLATTFSPSRIRATSPRCTGG